MMVAMLQLGQERAIAHHIFGALYRQLQVCRKIFFMGDAPDIQENRPFDPKVLFGSWVKALCINPLCPGYESPLEPILAQQHGHGCCLHKHPRRARM
jgi:hypothetical protein